MKLVSVEETDLNLTALAELAKDGPVILTRNGKPLAAVKDLSGSDWESVSLANNARFLALIEESRQSYREEGGIRLDDLRKELGLKGKPGARKRKQGRKPAG
jgi:hypothetical protein